MDLLAFYKDFGDRWMVVIVDVDPEERVGTVVDMQVGTEAECRVFGDSYLGPDTKEVYRATTEAMTN